jgi:hypothetical protein
LTYLAVGDGIVEGAVHFDLEVWPGGREMGSYGKAGLSECWRKLT